MAKKKVAEKVAEEFNRNAAALNELQDATEYRIDITYKTPDGWKPLFVSAADLLKCGAFDTVQKCLDRLVFLVIGIARGRVFGEVADDGSVEVVFEGRILDQTTETEGG